MSDYLIDGQWLMGRTSRVLSELKRLKKMLREGKKKDDDGSSIYFQIRSLKIERELLKEILKHTTDAERKEEKKG